MDTGSGSFHIYQHSQNNVSKNNIIPYDTDTFKCVCQSVTVNSTNPSEAYLYELNDTWYQYQENTITFTNNVTNITNKTIETSSKQYLEGCPSFNETLCNNWGEQCSFAQAWIYHDDEQQCINHKGTKNETSTPNICFEKTCQARRYSYGLVINGEHVEFKCNDNCYSGIDIIKFEGVINEDYQNIYNDNHYIPYVYADIIDLNSGGHNVSIFTNESWSDGLVGLTYDYNQATSFWQVLGINEQHTALIAFDTLRGYIDVGNVSSDYLSNTNENLIDYSESIWWTATYHYFYIYELTVCNIDIFDVLDIGSYYLVMIDTGATCLTLPPEIFDLLFKYIPYSFICNGNQTFCYISSDINEDDLDKYESFPMLSFKLNANNNDQSQTFYISLKDLIIKLSEDKETKYCIERGNNSIKKIGECSPDRTTGGNHDCTSKGIIIFGTRVLTSLYTIFDFPNKRVGFANNLITNYSRNEYNIANDGNCNMIQMNCSGDDVFNYSLNKCESGANECNVYWGWSYNEDTHYCVLQSWLYGIIPIVWLFIMTILLLFVKFKVWVDQHVYYTAIKV